MDVDSKVTDDYNIDNITRTDSYLINNTMQIDDYSNQSASTQDKFENKFEFEDFQQNIVQAEISQNMLKLSKLMNKEKSLIELKANNISQNNRAKNFPEIREGIQMVHHNLDNFFIVTLKKKKYQRKEE